MRIRAFRNSPIKLRQLATHTSSIIDREPFYDHTYFPGTQTAFDLKDFLLAYIEPDGEFYNLKNFSAYPPGARFEYSNVGADLAAFVVEAVRGVSYASYTRQRILKPLHMDASGWSPEETKGPLATLYDQHRKVIAPYSFPSYADGGLFSSCNDLGRFLSAMIRGYKGKSGLLRPELFRAMLTPQFSWNHPPRNIGPDDEPNEGIFWEFSRRGEIGHSGGDPGIDTHMFFNPESGIGRILITNMSGDGGRRDVDEELETIWKTLGTSEGKFVTGPGS